WVPALPGCGSAGTSLGRIPPRSAPRHPDRTRPGMNGRRPRPQGSGTSVRPGHARVKRSDRAPAAVAAQRLRGQRAGVLQVAQLIRQVALEPRPVLALEVLQRVDLALEVGLLRLEGREDRVPLLLRFAHDRGRARLRLRDELIATTLALGHVLVVD